MSSLSQVLTFAVYKRPGTFDLNREPGVGNLAFSGGIHCSRASRSRAWGRRSRCGSR